MLTLRSLTAWVVSLLDERDARDLPADLYDDVIPSGISSRRTGFGDLF